MSRRSNIISEFILFLKQNKSYYLIPVMVVILFLVALITVSVITGGAAAPFIYTLF